ncbi:hypothetical protein V1477_001631 [Vespula maculifrons]|uniref:Uncharacterized protein n=1 Tax=Vespula maculifrons TaxID=7453 RepID=A0ABD2CYF0_VESMC
MSNIILYLRKLFVNTRSSGILRKFLSPLAETDCQSPTKERKFLSSLLEMDFQSPPEVRKFLSPRKHRVEV